MDKQNILIINRWADEFADYANYIDHREHRVVYLVNAEGKLGIRAAEDEICEIIEVESLDDIDAMAERIAELIDRIGPLDKIIALSEWDLIQAASLRTQFGVPGISKEQVMLYKDKVAMKVRMRESGVMVPHFSECESNDQVVNFVSQVGFPVILKPKQGAASQGVHLVFDEEQLAKLLNAVELSEYECEEYVQGPILHVDGLVHEGELVYLSISRYVNTCLAFNSGTPLGSFMIEEGELKAEITAFTKRVLEGLELTNSAFHLEVILKHDEVPYFLEIGARVGGGEVPFLAKRLYGVDLMHEWVKIESGQFQGLTIRNPDRLGGFLMVPEPAATPCRVVSATSLLGTLPTLVHEVLPEPGTVLDGHGGYEKISGRFLFIGDSEAEMEVDIRSAIERFEIQTEKETAETVGTA